MPHRRSGLRISRSLLLSAGLLLSPLAVAAAEGSTVACRV